ncbi:MAG: hypothetical protein AAFQ10_06745 [Pseudomonadota bacterium]
MQHAAVQSSPNVIVHALKARSVRVAEPQSHDDLLWLATSRFCKTERQSRLSHDQFSEAFNLLVGTASTSMKRAICALLADCPYTPRAIAIYLALEKIETATPMLARSTVLGQLDLMQIVQRHPNTHGKIIATRPDLGPSLVKHLQGLQVGAIDDALDKNYALPDPMKTRSADALFNQLRQKHHDVHVAMRRTEKPTQSTTRQTKMGQASTSASPSQQLVEAAARGGLLAQQAEQSKAHRKNFNFGQALERAAQARSRQAMAVLMQKQAGITLGTAHQVLDDKSGDTFAVLMRAYGVDDAQANRILLLAQPGIGLSVHNAMRAVRFYSALKRESCLEAVSQWPMEQTKPVKHQPMLADTQKRPRVRQINAKAAIQSVQWASQRKAS